MNKFLTLLFTTCAAMTLSSSAAVTKAACCCDVKPDAPGALAVSTVLPSALPNRSLYQLDSTWTNDAGLPVQLLALRGQPVIVAMFFAQCEYVCPMTVNDIQRARESLSPAVRDKAQVLLVSFDSERDTPAALRAYRERMALDSRWTLLRGDAGSVQDFAMLLGVKFKRDERGQFAHSNLITVLNDEGEVVHQRVGLQGDVSELAQAVTRAVK